MHLAGKVAIEDDSSDSAPEELPSLTSNLKKPDWEKVKDLPKCPTPSRMFNWSPMDYQLYDEYLIAKFNALGFSRREKTYVVSFCLFSHNELQLNSFFGALFSHTINVRFLVMFTIMFLLLFALSSMINQSLCW